MEGPSNGGMLYHEVQEGKLCAVHCVNTVLQGPFFSEFDLAALASDLDQTERQMMTQNTVGAGDFASAESHNVSLGGDFSIQLSFALQLLCFDRLDAASLSVCCCCCLDLLLLVFWLLLLFLISSLHVCQQVCCSVGTGLIFCSGSRWFCVLQKALEVWDLQVIPLDSPVAEPAQIDPEEENAFICHLQDHWFTIRKVNGEWYNFDSLYAAPEQLSKFYLSAYLDSLKGAGWSIFLVRGNFPKECPLSSEASNGFGQWLTPEDCVRILKACNSKGESSREVDPVRRQTSDQFSSLSEAELLAMEDEDLKAAIAASLMDSSPAIPISEASVPSTEKSN